MSLAQISGTCLCGAVKCDPDPGGSAPWGLPLRDVPSLDGSGHHEIYIDRKPAGYSFAGDHERKTKQEVEASFASFSERET